MIKGRMVSFGFGKRAAQRVNLEYVNKLLDPGETVVATAMAMRHGRLREEILLGHLAAVRMKSYIVAATTQRLLVLEHMIGGVNPVWAIPLYTIVVHHFKKGLLGTKLSLQQHGQELHLRIPLGFGAESESIREAIAGTSKP